MSQKMFALVPESCITPTDLHQLDSSLSHYSHIPFHADRGGIKDRDYRQQVYTLTERDTGKVGSTGYRSTASQNMQNGTL